MQAIIPDYNAEIDKEGKIINENTEALDRYNAVLATNIELKEVADELDKHRINLMRLQKSPALVTIHRWGRWLARMFATRFPKKKRLLNL